MLLFTASTLLVALVAAVQQPSGDATGAPASRATSRRSAQGVDPATSRPARRPNIVLIMADDIGVECFGCYGGSSYETPVIDGLARRGMRFTQCYSQPLCTPSRVKLMTGRSNARNYRAFSVLPPGERTFAQVLQAGGYETAVAGKWQLYAAEHYPENLRGTGTLPAAAGFDAWCLWQVEKMGSRYWGPGYLADGEFVTAPKKIYGPDVYTDYLLAFMEKNKARPFLAYFPMALVHNPFVPAPGSGDARDKRGPKHFASMVSYMDRIVGRIVAKVEALGISEQTIILFTGDNGTNRQIRSKVGDRIVRGGKGRTDATGNHVPLLALWPGRIEAGSTCNDLVDFADFFPTLVQLAGLKLPEGVVLDGLSFAPQLLGKKGRAHDSLYCYYHPRPITRKKSRPVSFAFDKHWKLYADGRFYDLDADRLEEQVLPADEDDEARKAARARLQRRLDTAPHR